MIRPHFFIVSLSLMLSPLLDTKSQEGPQQNPGTEERQQLLPKNTEAQALFIVWNDGARLDGTIPGAYIGLLGESVKTFTTNDPASETTPQLLEMLPRFDATRDWSALDALALLDELAAVHETPITAAFVREMALNLGTGAPLPPELARAPWGEAHPNGLRVAWLFEPRGLKQPLHTKLKSRILIHNVGKKPVVFRTRTWQQVSHTASNSSGDDIPMQAVVVNNPSSLTPFRLAPGEFVELDAPPVGVGANKYFFASGPMPPGSWVCANVGDVVTLTPGHVPLSDENEELPPDGEPGWWLDFVKARLARELPLPADDEVRRRLLDHVAIDLFGMPVSDEEMTAFASDREPSALDSLAQRLAHSACVTPYTGSLASGPTKFLVLPEEPDASEDASSPAATGNP